MYEAFCKRDSMPVSSLNHQEVEEVLLTTNYGLAGVLLRSGVGADGGV